MLKNYLNLTRLDRPIGIFLLLWPTLWALWLANSGIPPLNLLVIFVLGTVVTRTAGCIINDLADIKYDVHVARTKRRALASNLVSKKHAILVLGVLLIIAASLLFFLNELSRRVALLSLVLIIAYPLMKRFTNLAQVFLGITFSMGIIMSYGASQNVLPLEAWCLALICILYTIAYDTIYAMLDKSDDLKIGVHSTAILFKEKDSVYTFFLQLLVIVLLGLFGLFKGLGFGYCLAIIFSLGLFIYQYYLTNFSKKYMKAFLNNNLVGLTIFLGIFFDTWH